MKVTLQGRGWGSAEGGREGRRGGEVRGGRNEDNFVGEGLG